MATVAQPPGIIEITDREPTLHSLVLALKIESRRD
jgi:hypothetical protein